jgi:hypothetical protein
MPTAFCAGKFLRCRSPDRTRHQLVGQINGGNEIYLSSPVCKNIPVRAHPKSLLYPLPSRPTEGRLAIVTNAGRDAVDAAAPARTRRDRRAGFIKSVSDHRARRRTALLRTAKSCGPDASTPASSLRRLVGPTGIRQSSIRKRRGKAHRTHPLLEGGLGARAR